MPLNINLIFNIFQLFALMNVQMMTMEAVILQLELALVILDLQETTVQVLNVIISNLSEFDFEFDIFQVFFAQMIVRMMPMEAVILKLELALVKLGSRETTVQVQNLQFNFC